METKTENQWKQLKKKCLAHAIDILSGEDYPNVACVEIAERLTNMAIAIDRRKQQEDALSEIKTMNQHFDSMKGE